MQDNNTTLNALVGQRLLNIRTSMHLSQDEFGKLVGLHRTYIGQIERADKNVSIKTIEQICNAINMDVKDFFDFSNLKWWNLLPSFFLFY